MFYILTLLLVDWLGQETFSNIAVTLKVPREIKIDGKIT